MFYAESQPAPNSLIPTAHLDSWLQSLSIQTLQKECCTKLGYNKELFPMSLGGASNPAVCPAGIPQAGQPITKGIPNKATQPPREAYGHCLLWGHYPRLLHVPLRSGCTVLIIEWYFFKYMMFTFQCATGDLFWLVHLPNPTVSCNVLDHEDAQLTRWY